MPWGGWGGFKGANEFKDVQIVSTLFDITVLVGWNDHICFTWPGSSQEARVLLSWRLLRRKCIFGQSCGQWLGWQTGGTQQVTASASSHLPSKTDWLSDWLVFTLKGRSLSSESTTLKKQTKNKVFDELRTLENSSRNPGDFEGVCVFGWALYSNEHLPELNTRWYRTLTICS